MPKHKTTAYICFLHHKKHELKREKFELNAFINDQAINDEWRVSVKI